MRELLSHSEKRMKMLQEPFEFHLNPGCHFFFNSILYMKNFIALGQFGNKKVEAFRDKTLAVDITGWELSLYACVSFISKDSWSTHDVLHGLKRPHHVMHVKRRSEGVSDELSVWLCSAGGTNTRVEMPCCQRANRKFTRPDMMTESTFQRKRCFLAN